MPWRNRGVTMSTSTSPRCATTQTRYGGFADLPAYVRQHHGGRDREASGRSLPAHRGVTDGEASHPRSPTVTPMALTDLRSRERHRAFDLLGLGARVHSLGLPDGAVGDDPSELAACLRSLLARDVLCVAPWEHDGHPDHDATGHAAAEACAATGARFPTRRSCRPTPWPASTGRSRCS